LILVLLFISGFLFAFASISTLCAIGWKRKSDDAINSANYNAELWAKSEAERHESEIENATLRQALSTTNKALEVSDKAFVAMSKIASEAIQTSEVNNNLRLPAHPDSDDSILNAQNVG
jgi:hypothetical protein